EYDGEFTFFVGGGVAVLDCDDDDLPDLYLAGGTNPAGLFRNVSSTGGPLAFEPVADPATDLEGVTGAYPLDVDADGIGDLAVLRVGENVLLRGLGGCRFERANEAWGFDGGDDWTAAFAATWEGDAARPTLAIGNYLEVPEPGDPGRTCAESSLHRPTAGGWEAAPLVPGLCPLSMLFSDWDRTGRHDLRVANDRHYYDVGSEQLWRVETGADPVLYAADDGWRELQIWGMGIATHDVTGDGLPEVFITSQGDNKLQTLVGGPGEPTYEDIAIRRGATAHRPFMGGESLPSTAWHAQFEDVNHDGFMDLFVAKGNVDAQVDHAAADPSNLLLGGADGVFVEAAREAGVVSLGRGRGAALADLNGDGWLDLVEVNRRENVRLWRNRGVEGDGHWRAGDLRPPPPPGAAGGAWVEGRAGDLEVARQVLVGGGHAGGVLGPVHVGLGDEGEAEIRVTWPDGEVGPWVPVEVDRTVVIDRGG
ncbi:MAG: CRTAC1 family protein, partial [Acidimicrobiia bacterium]